MEEGFWLPLLAAVAVILFSFFVFTKFFNKKTNTSTVSDSETSSSNPNSSSTSNPLPSAPYEVFLSFRGPDTRYAFTDFLYNDLVDARIRTFRDDNELRKGEEIGPELLRAITESKISISIFSKNYASSKWCLRELAKMWECRTSMGQIILPIFFDVEPSDVRHQTGTYKKAFNEHQRHFDGDTVRGWREALKGVGALKGWDLNKETGGHQGKLVKMVVSKVLLELKKNYMVVTDRLVAIDHHIEEVSRLLDFHSSDVRIVGIHGMGGLGKTTIAKVIYNKLSKSFEHCSFLADVREISQQKGLVNLQIQLNSKILKRKGLDIDTVNDGHQMTKDTVFGKKVLIVLDDVAESSQFEMLVGERDWYGSGSRFIVTTRNKKVLDDLKVDGAYEPPTMEPYYSLQLFSKHAFREDFPPDDYDLLSKDVASTAAGLPLALEIIGSLLCGRGKAVWKDTLKKLRKRPDDKVQAILRISYEALDYEQKQIFLDIACLPIGVDKRIAEYFEFPGGMDKGVAFYMWDACEFFPESGIDVLFLMSLVKFEDGDFLWMHDQLIGLGREIVRQENFKEPGERSRLWSHEEAMDVLEGRMGTKKVEVLCLDFKFGYPGLCFTSEVFTELSNLRFLKVDCAELTGDFKHLLSKLRWLHWQNCPGKFTPTSLCLKNLVILDLSCSRITNDWKAWSQIMMSRKLKILDLSYCNCLTRTPDFSTFGSLERLILKGCGSMIHIDPSIGNLIHLRVLDISGSAITKFPDAIGNLKELEIINASSCSLQGKIPSSIGRLSSLKILNLMLTKISHLPVSICGLCDLQTLDLYGCRELQSLPQLPHSLTSLRVTCKQMEAFPSLPNLTSLKKLHLEECRNLAEVPGNLGKLSELETLTLIKTSIRSLPAGIGGLRRLNQLEINSCKNIRCIMGLPSGLHKLSVNFCDSFERLPDLSNLEILSELKLSACPELVGIQGFGKLKLLTSLEVSGSEKLCELDGLEQLECLIHLNISQCSYLERVPDLSNLKKLKKLLAYCCPYLILIQGLEQLESLEYLDISECVSLEKFPDLSKLGMLKDLVLRECHNLVEAEGLWASKSLERLDMSSCKWSKRLPDLSNLKKLKELRIRDCGKLTEIQGLDMLNSLEYLNIADCESLGKLPDMSNLNSLITLIAPGCEKLTELPGLEGLKSLRLLEITGCRLIEDLPDFPNTEIRRHTPYILLRTYA
ncbi:disease resistance protein L6-like [Cornus florida]|uniref:disease resistance protein L6-like n=1 Tax=Cornus florida TaxID=4283 RepID=UPI002896E529|nr:disease resistance protein L6-like [Cornus florida]XP_059667699.1 disease resistance protein L6-like [Cornus florida]XP_059667700.1 disease resistance protein L6-like [Cornus florida]